MQLIERGPVSPTQDVARADPGPRWPVLVYSRPVIAFGAFFAAAYAVLAGASGLSTGDWSP